MPAAEKLEINKTIEDCVQCMKRMLECMLERMLLLGRVQAPMLEFHPQQVDLFQVCEELVGGARIEHSMSHSEITIDFSASTASG